VLEFVEVALDQIALAIDLSADGALDQAASHRWDMRLGTTGSDQGEQCVGIVAAISDDMTARQAGQQMRCRVEIVGLASCQHEPDRQSAFVDDRIDFRAQSATRTTDGVILAPFFPPAACWWARMMELSIRAMDFGDFAARASKTLTHTPARAHRLKRL
jgi:hypothetical protein